MRDIVFVGQSLEDLRGFPEEARREAGFCLRSVKALSTPARSKQLVGFSGAGVTELRLDDRSGTFRVVYTVSLPDAVYVLHAFQKKSTRGINTAQRDVDLIRRRLARAIEISRDRTTEGENADEQR